MENSVPRLKLGDILAEYEPIHVLGTTFTLSLAFFESSVWPRIKTNRLSNFLIISDRIGLSRAYQEAPALKLAGREYVATAAPTKRTFHPKVWLLIEERRALLLVGSGNLTQAGFMENLELFEAIEIGTETKCSAKLREDIKEFIQGLRSLWPVQGLSDELPALRALDQILKAFADLPTELSESEECKRRMFHSFQGKFTELLPQVEAKQTLSVASPYFGGSEKGLIRLKESLKAAKVAVYPAVHRDDGVDLNVKQKNKLDGFEYHRLKVEDDRFAHLKLISATGVQGKDWIFSGSVNCTDAALSAENIEAGLWRPLDQKTIQTYFEKDQAPLPSKRTELTNVISDSVSGAIHFSAVFNGSSLKLYPAPTQNPIQNVSITVSTSSREFKAHFGRAFDDQGSLYLGLNSFGKPLQFSGSAVVSISAKSEDGDYVEGNAFVEDSTVLYSDAGTRRALQYALMMVESDSIDDSLDCLDDLLNSLDGLEDFALPLEGTEDGGAKGRAPEKEQSVLPPIWPPIVLPSSIAAKSGANVLGSIHFAQRILSALFGYESAAAASENVHELLIESEQDQVAPLAKSKKADHNWSFIENRFECLCERLRELEPDQTSSKNLWAMGATFLLVTLIARRAYRQPATTLTKILREFIRSTFVPRPQDNFSRQAHTRYSTRVFPALAVDLRDNFKTNPS